MKKTRKEAVKGSPFPPTWLKRFSELVPLSTFNLMSRTCKTIHYNLRLNVVWKERSRKLPEFAELSRYEQEVWIAQEGFWYEWYMDRVVRTLPLVDWGSVGSNANLKYPPGLLASKSYVPTTLKTCFVITSTIFDRKAKCHTAIMVAATVNSIHDALSSKRVKFKRVTTHKITIRPAGNLSVDLIRI